MRTYQYLNRINHGLLVMLSIILITSCKKFIAVDAPKTSINDQNVYENDATASAVLTGLYIKMSSQGLKNAGLAGISFYSGLSADELSLNNITDNATSQAFFTNSLTTATFSDANFWSQLYGNIFICNAAISGVQASKKLTPVVQKQLLGEAKFLRAFNYFYLVNLFGNLPLVTSTDYATNATLSRMSSTDIYKQIVIDLLEAETELSDNFVDNSLVTTTEERVRPNKWAAKALLARVYLYTSDYSDAETIASELINNSGLFGLPSLTDAFKKNSKEAIWQLQPVNAGYNTEDARLFVIPSTGFSSTWPTYLSERMVSAFESGDQRKAQWTGVFTDTTVTPHKDYYYPYKYKAYKYNDPVTEYAMVLRLGEQYLIRAEARAHLGNLGGAADDLYAIRQRAGLAKINFTSESQAVNDILHERQVELFSEWGHRWLDLKRTGKVDEVMQVVTPLKGGTWNTNWQLYPIPSYDLSKDPNLAQNPGYN